MFGGEYDSTSLFSGGGFMPSQATQNHDLGFSPAKNRDSQVLTPLTVKQISEGYQTSDDKSNFVIDGVEVNNITLVGIVTNKMEKVTDVSFSLDDGTGRIEVQRWVNDAAESNEVAELQNGTYVRVHGHLKGFQGRRQVSAFSVRPVIDFSEIAYHFISCIYVHAYNRKIKGGIPAQAPANFSASTPYQSGLSVPQSAVTNQVPSHPGMDKSGSDLDRNVLAVFLEPKSLSEESGIHVDYVVERLGIPKHKIMQSIEYHVDMGNIYSTIDENHYKSTCNG